MKNKKAILANDKPDDWIAFASDMVDLINFNYQNYDKERSSVIVSAKTYEKMKQLSDEFRANNIV